MHAGVRVYFACVVSLVHIDARPVVGLDCLCVRAHVCEMCHYLVMYSVLCVPAGQVASHYWIRHLCRVPAALGKGTFAECGSRQSPLGKEVVGKGIFAECHVAGTRQRICRVPHQHSAKVTGAVNLTAPFAECRRVRHSTKEIFF